MTRHDFHILIERYKHATLKLQFAGCRFPEERAFTVEQKKDLADAESALLKALFEVIPE